MISCLIGLVIAAIVLLIVAYVIETVVTTFLPLPPKVLTLIRLLLGLLLLLYALSCLGVMPWRFEIVR